MKNFKNNFKITGFVGYSNIRKFQNTSVCRFSISVSQKNQKDERTTAFLNIEAWRKNDTATEDFQLLEKGKLITLEGYFKPEEWTDESGEKHNKIIMVATKFYLTEDKEEVAEASEEETCTF